MSKERQCRALGNLGNLCRKNNDGCLIESFLDRGISIGGEEFKRHNVEAGIELIEQNEGCLKHEKLLENFTDLLDDTPTVIIKK